MKTEDKHGQSQAGVSRASGNPIYAVRSHERATWRISVPVIVFALVVWAVATNHGWITPLFLPPPQAVWRQLLSIATDGFADATLLTHIAWSMARVLGAFALAAVTAVPVGALVATSRLARGIVDPFIEFYRPLPPLAYLPLVVLWLGIGECSKVVLIYLAMFAPIALSTRAGISSVALEQIRAALSMGATRGQLLRYVLLPAALPEILTGMRIAMGFGWTTLVAAEMVAATAGLGFMVLSASKFMATDVVVAGILVIGAIGYLFDLGMRQIERRLVPWCSNT